MNSKLFRDTINSKDTTYLMVRDCTRPEIFSGKNFMEHLWNRYHEYADKDFPQKLSEDFPARFWEMYLTCTLLEKSCSVCPRLTYAKGPDIKILNPCNSIYLEAVTPSEGISDNKDRVHEMPLMTAVKVPDEEITLRYCSAIADKFEKYKSYLKNNSISSNDVYVIALNSCKIKQAIMETDIPRILKAVLPFGDPQVTISKRAGVKPYWSYQYRDKIYRYNTSSVPTDLFLNQNYDGLSGILYSRTDLFNKPKRMGDNFIFIHNPLARNPLPHGYFKFGMEYYINLETNSLNSKDWSYYEQS
ncbi:MAG: hypothetical protein JW967_01115 [Dehalococcoidales bacterium]|nr:hypothetical protein [Dehalococcoidales bacterium]